MTYRTLDAEVRVTNDNVFPSPAGRGLERTSAQRSFLRERVRVDSRQSA